MQKRNVWTVPLKPVQPILCENKNAVASKKKRNV